MKLSDLSLTLETTDAEIRGRKVVLRFVPAWVAGEIAVALPGPRVPMWKNPAKGSMAEEEPDYGNPVYVAQEDQVNYLRRAALLAWSMGVEVGVGGLTPPEVPRTERSSAYFQAVSIEMMEALDRAELSYLAKRLASLTMTGAIEEALKN